MWHQFADWYIEFAKTAFDSPDSRDPAARRRADTTSAVLLEVLSALLRLIHPLMPYISEELWHKLPQPESYLATAEWPRADESKIDETAERQVELLQETIVKIRHMRAESNIEPGRRIRVSLHADDPRDAALLRAEAALVSTLVRADRIELVSRLDTDSVAARGVVRGLQIAIPLEGVLDLPAERKRLRRDLDKVSRELDTRGRKLSNNAFLERAPAEVVEKERRLQHELLERRQRLEHNLELLGAEPQRGS